MFNFLNKNKTIKRNTSIGEVLKTDMHSHLLPGIDDGAPDIETSIKLIRGLIDLGYSRLITTPHIMNDMYPNKPNIISEKLEELRAAIKKENIDVEIYAAAEYYVDEFFEEYIQSEKLLAITGNKILVEQSMIQEYPRFKDVIYKLRLKGYTPVIAHPERYVYYFDRRHEFQWLKDAGCLLQVNILSLQGYYGKLERKLAEFLIKEQMVDFLGTDCHHERHLNRLNKFNEESQVTIDPLLLINKSLSV